MVSKEKIFNVGQSTDLGTAHLKWHYPHEIWHNMKDWSDHLQELPSKVC